MNLDEGASLAWKPVEENGVLADELANRQNGQMDEEMVVEREIDGSEGNQGQLKRIFGREGARRDEQAVGRVQVEAF